MDSAGPSSGFETFRQALCVLVVEVAWSEPEGAEPGRRSPARLYQCCAPRIAFMARCDWFAVRPRCAGAPRFYRRPRQYPGRRL